MKCAIRQIEILIGIEPILKTSTRPLDGMPMGRRSGKYITCFKCAEQMKTSEEWKAHRYECHRKN